MNRIVTREVRRFGKENIPIIPEKEGGFPKERNTNFFYDEHGVAEFGRARLATENASGFPYASGPGLWKTVNDRLKQWERVKEINEQRIADWKRKADEADQIPM
jgi:hypothetical protein